MLIVQYYFISEQRLLNSAAIFNRRGMINNYASFAAYVFAGVGATMFWPEPVIQEPRPGDKYKTDMGVTAVIPVGLGIKYIISDDWIIVTAATDNVAVSPVSTYAYRHDDGGTPSDLSDDLWIPWGRLRASDAVELDLFGWSASISSRRPT